MIQVPDDIFVTQPRFKFGKASLERLQTCDHRLELICRVLANYQNISILCGHRGRAAQNAAYPKYSKVKWPNSKHNTLPSIAVDIAPYPIDWNDKLRFASMAGRFQQIADILDIEVKWGADWDRDTNTDDHSFIDLPHFELVNPDAGNVDLDEIMKGRIT